MSTKKKVAAKAAKPAKKAAKPAVKHTPVKPAAKHATASHKDDKHPVKAAASASHAVPAKKAVETKAQPAKPVVMPKIIATTSRKYEPEFTKSVLDQPAIENFGPTMRYSDAELIEFRELIAQ